MKAWITFEKKPRLRHIGHLDLMRAMQRALRKSDLPICFSKGFNPHLQLTFAAPLSVGMYGLHEVMEVPLEGDVTAEEVMDKLSRALPPELPCVSVRMVDDKHPAPMALLRAAAKNYESVVALSDPADYGLALEGLRNGALGRAERRRAWHPRARSDRRSVLPRARPRASTGR